MIKYTLHFSKPRKHADGINAIYERREHHFEAVSDIHAKSMIPRILAQYRLVIDDKSFEAGWSELARAPVAKVVILQNAA